MYFFYKADEQPEANPLFVFFNGGPGCATSSGLLSNNTAPYSLDKRTTAGEPYATNPYSFTRLGNLLYIDAPNTGFSYNVVENAVDQSVREEEFDAQNFNIYLDAAQFIRFILRFLNDTPSIKATDVILVGESYGGTRAIYMLNLLLFYSRYGDGSKIYKDSSLAEEIQDHFESINSSLVGQTVPPETIAGQFGSQVLIEPLITGQYQDDLAGAAFEEPDSVIYQIASATGTTFTPCAEEGCDPYENALTFVSDTAQREIYQYDQDAGFLDELEEFALQGLDTASVLSTIAGLDVSLITYLPPTYRDNAYRFIETPSSDLDAIMNGERFENLPASARMRLRQDLRRLALANLSESQGAGETLETVLGALNPWDAYLVQCNSSAFTTFYDNSAIQQGYQIDPYTTVDGELFLQNLALVDTFITDGIYDLVIYSAVIPDSIKEYASIVENVEWRIDGEDGYIDVYYKEGSLEDVTTPASRTIYFPRYTSSGHMVSLMQPDKFRNDVEGWLAQLP